MKGNHWFCLFCSDWATSCSPPSPRRLYEVSPFPLADKNNKKTKTGLLPVRQIIPKLGMKLTNPSSASFPSWAFCSVIVYICLIPKKLLVGGKKPSKNVSSPLWPLDPLAEDKRGLPKLQPSCTALQLHQYSHYKWSCLSKVTFFFKVRAFDFTISIFMCSSDPSWPHSVILELIPPVLLLSACHAAQ